MTPILKKIFPEINHYGLNKIIREYCKYPKFLPLACHWEHGWTPKSESINSDEDVKKPLMLVMSKRRKEKWLGKNITRVRISGAMFIHYRNLNKITPSSRARGTLAFPAHATSRVDSLFSQDDYCKDLIELDKNLQPVTICLHSEDIKRGKEKIYKKYGFKVVSAGDMYSSEFPFRFYNILKKYKYSTSNIPGSYMLYSVEMGIPFFIYGDYPIMKNNGGDSNFPNEYSIYEYKYARIARHLFKYKKGEIPSINLEQKAFVTEEAGINDCLKPNDLKKELYRSLFVGMWNLIIKKIASILHPREYKKY